jgi:hypothetical protein
MPPLTSGNCRLTAEHPYCTSCKSKARSKKGAKVQDPLLNLGSTTSVTAAAPLLSRQALAVAMHNTGNINKHQ